MSRVRPYRLIRGLLAIVLLAAAAPAPAGNRISIGLNQTLRIPLTGTASSVVVANASIADITMVDAHSAVVIGKAFGTAQVMVLDAGGRTLLDSLVTVSAQPDTRIGSEVQITLFRGGQPPVHYNCGGRCEADSPTSASEASSAGGAAMAAASSAAALSPVAAPSP
jgi:hypothetical protein